MLGSLTVLPAVLSKLGDRVEKGRIPFLHRLRRADGESRVWDAILDRVLRRPLVSAVAAAGLLVALAIPALHMNTKESGSDGLPQDLPIVQTYERIQAEFPGSPLPAVVVVSADDVTAPEVAGAVRELRAQAIDTGLMNDPVNVTTNDRGDVAVVTIPMAGDGTDERSIDALDRPAPGPDPGARSARSTASTRTSPGHDRRLGGLQRADEQHARRSSSRSSSGSRSCC